MGYDVFISYSRRDMSIIDKFEKGLTDAGYTVWIDRTGVSGGDEFRRKIVQGIKQSSVVLFFSSVNSNASEWTVKEIIYAVSKKKVIIPVRLDKTEYAESIDFDICGLSYVECDPNQPLSCLDLLVTYIANHIGQRQSTAARKTNQSTDVRRSPKELYSLGVSYYEREDYEQAVKYFRQAAERGSVDAQSMLGFCYDNGQGVAQDYSEAVKWYRKAAEQGNAVAQFNLGNRYYYGQGVARDYGEAVKWYHKAAEHGDANAQNNLGNCYFYGKGVGKNIRKAVKWYRKAAKQGHAKGQNSLGNCYYKGRGVDRNYGLAEKLYRKAADQGNANAQRGLGNCYYNGKGVAQDFSEAAKWYCKSAEQGDSIAQFVLGVCYENGKGVPKDLDEAVKWYRKAAEQGNENAIEALKRLGK